jgi:hypothetical protein
MRRETCLKSVVFYVVIVLFRSAYALAGTWETLDYPGLNDIWIEGVSNGYICGYTNIGGYTYDGTTWKKYNRPGYYTPMVTAAWGNTIVGHIQDASSNHHGFLYDGVTWTTIDKPGATSTIIKGTNGSCFVGNYYASGSHGFVYDGTTWTTVDKPGAYFTSIYGISGNNIFGNVENSGFTYDGSTWRTYDAPGASFTEIQGISGNYIVGNYMKPANVWHGFIYDGSVWTTLDMPRSNGSIAGITGDTIVGSYYDYRLRGFLYTIPEPATILMLGLGGVMIRKFKIKSLRDRREKFKIAE